MSPKAVASYMDLSRKLILQASPDVDRIEQSYKTLKGFGTAIVTCLTGVGAWFGLINNK